eukprot:scaffold186789_cov22-Tisochrysis_lutea.AAC.2
MPSGFECPHQQQRWEARQVGVAIAPSVLLPTSTLAEPGGGPKGLKVKEAKVVPSKQVGITVPLQRTALSAKSVFEVREPLEFCWSRHLICIPVWGGGVSLGMQNARAETHIPMLPSLRDASPGMRGLKGVEEKRKDCASQKGCMH